MNCGIIESPDFYFGNCSTDSVELRKIWHQMSEPRNVWNGHLFCVAQITTGLVLPSPTEMPLCDNNQTCFVCDVVA